MELCKQNGIYDLNTLLMMSENDFEKIEFPLGIIKKVSPYLKST